MDNQNPPDSELFITRKGTLPHWSYRGSIYFETWRILKNQPQLSPGERTMVASVLNYFHEKRYELLCYVVMDDHVHVLLRPLKNEILRKIVLNWKSYATNRLQRELGRKGRLWQHEYFDRIIRNEKEFYNTAKYILNNPLKRWKVEHYPWKWFKFQNDDDAAATEAR